MRSLRWPAVMQRVTVGPVDAAASPQAAASWAVQHDAITHHPMTSRSNPWAAAALLAVATATAAQNEASYTVPRASILKGSCTLPVDHSSLSAPAQVAVVYQLSVVGALERHVVVRSSGEAAADEAVMAALAECAFVRAGHEGDDARIGYVVVPLGLRTPAAEARTPAIANVQSCAPSGKDYPANERRRNQRGTTKLRFSVNERGQLLRTEVVSTSGSARLDDIAAGKLSTCQFHAGTDVLGRPQAGDFEVTYIWQLK